MPPPDSDPSAVDRLSTFTDHTDVVLDYTSDTGTYTLPRPNPSNRWSMEPLHGQGAPNRLSLDSGRPDNGGFERHQYPTPLPTPTGLGVTRTISTTLPNISPEASRSRLEEQRPSTRDPSGSIIRSSYPSSAGLVPELGEFPRTFQDPHAMYPSSTSSPDQHLLSTVSPPSHDEATNTLGPMHSPRNRLWFDGAHVDSHHATYDVPPHQGTYPTPRSLAATPRRHDGRSTPLPSAYIDHPRFTDGQLPYFHGQSMKKSALAFSRASECLSTPNILTRGDVQQPVQFPQSGVSSRNIGMGSFYIYNEPNPLSSAPAAPAVLSPPLSSLDPSQVERTVLPTESGPSDQLLNRGLREVIKVSNNVWGAHIVV